MEDNLLEVGDVLYIPKKFSNKYDGTEKIVRVTPKQAELESGIKVYRTVEKGFVRKVGYSSYGVNHFHLETEALKEKHSLSLMQTKVSHLLQSINADLLTKEQCELVINTLSPLKDLSKQ